MLYLVELFVSIVTVLFCSLVFSVDAEGSAEERPIRKLVRTAVAIAFGFSVSVLAIGYSIRTEERMKVAEGIGDMSSADTPMEVVEDSAGLTVLEFSDDVVCAVFDTEVGILTFSGEGSVDNTRIWLRLDKLNRAKVKKIIFADGITTVGSNFENIWGSFMNLEEVVFEGDIKAIDDDAFIASDSLVSVEFCGHCTKVGSNAFSSCASLQKVKFGDEVDYIEWGAFQMCPSLCTVTFEAKCGVISIEAFEECTSLEKVVFKDGVDIIKGSAFRNDTSLTLVKVIGGCGDLSDLAFDGCTSLEGIKMVEKTK